jgi:hypothetical protein
LWWLQSGRIKHEINSSFTYFDLQSIPCNAVDGDKVETLNSVVVTKTTTEEGILW